MFYPEAEKIAITDPNQLSSDGWLILHGGGDIHPDLYQHEDVGSHVGKKPSPRDVLELSCFERAVEIGLPVLGICRGAQMGCIGSGGTLIQDASGHEHPHMMQTRDGKKMVTSSIHHQMMYPNGAEHELLAWSMPRLSRHYRYGGVERITSYIEPEVIWFPKTKCLAVQGHPEYFEVYTPFNRYVAQLMKEQVK